MPTETIAPDSFTVEAETREADITPEEFCEAFRDISNVQRHAIAGLLHVPPSILTAGNLPRVTTETSAPKIIRQIEMLTNSPQMAHHIEQCIENGNYPELLNDEQLRSYIMGLAKTGLVGGLIDGLLDAGRIPKRDKRSYRESLLDMSHGFKDLVDSQFGRGLGLSRHQLGGLIDESYGAAYDRDSHRLASWVERGIAVEVATKRYMEESGASLGIKVRYGTNEEDAKKVDIVCEQGTKILGVDVKASDKYAGEEGNAHARHSPIEEHNVSEYRVRELYPAVGSCIGDDFNIKALAYKHVIDQLMEEFNALS